MVCTHQSLPLYFSAPCTVHLRNGLHQDRGQDFDIYAYDLVQDVEIPVAVMPGQQRAPAIHGDMVVWSDNRNRPEDAPSREGCSNCPDNPFDIYAYNLPVY